MAHFAELDNTNKVLRVIVVSNKNETHVLFFFETRRCSNTFETDVYIYLIPVLF